MKILRSASELIWPTASVGLVPTMGAFHEGHLSLMRRAKESCGYCVISLFVNPTQFGKGEDFDNYPRNEQRDFELAEAAGVDAIFAPSADEMYRDSCTVVTVGGVTDLWEGPLRPGHFDGVATVVAKLFGIIRPSDAFFGLKDYQQCRVIDRMVRDLHLPLRLHFEETVRESDGLAMSSRNVYLDPEQRAQAPKLHEILQSTRQEILAESDINEAIAKGRAALETAGFDVQYLAAVDPNMMPVSTMRSEARLIVAAKFGRIRLIDNIAI